MNKILPSISIVIATFNSERTIDLCLGKIRDQDYPQSLIEIITADGGSSDKTSDIAKKYGAKIISIDKDKQNAEYNKGMGFKHAKNDIVLFLDHDNIIPHNSWLKRIVYPFSDDPQIIGVEPLRFHYDRSMTLLDRYFALFGGSDPVVYYFGKNSHLSWAYKKYNLFGKSEDKGSYYKITFSPDKIPALGGNGAAFRRKDLLSFTNVKPENFIHTDLAAELIMGGHNQYAMIKDTIKHLTNNRAFPFLARRKYFVEKYQMGLTFKRKYKIYDPKKDKGKLFKYFIFSITFVVPLWDSTKGFLRVRDIAWFLHPFMCLAFLVIYSIPVLKGGIKNVLLEK